MNQINDKILDGYFSLIDSLNADLKKELIDRLDKSGKKVTKDKPVFLKAYGQWDTEQTAEELNDSLRKSRHTDRKIEEL